MGKVIRCVYCNWVGREPSPAEYSTDTAYLQAVREFEEHQRRFCCNDDTSADAE